MHRKPRGFTLIEAVICLVVAAILFGIAVGTWTEAAARVQSNAARNTMLASIETASRHALVAGSEVVMCPGKRDSGCSDSYDWSGGWIAFADIDGDRTRDPIDTLLCDEGPLDHRVRLLTSPGRRRLVFQPNGGNAGSNATFTICDTRGPADAEALVLANNGRFRSGRPKEAIRRECARRLRAGR